ncbi:MAG: pilus (MSHA type) biogenesis protein MshL [Gammaproteobacteria bacterium]|nr:MAG: pilus (MSHA type) biogenesis protein MshL [Gammaproteobacteria bacterium]
MKHWSLIGTLVVLSGCASQAMKPASEPPRLDDRTATAIEQSLDESVAQATRRQGKPVTPPQPVLEALLPEPAARTTGDTRFALDVEGMAARDFFLGLVKGTRYNMIVHPDVKGDIALHLKDVTVPEVMEAVRDLYGYDFRREGNLFKVLPSGVRTEIYPINYLNVTREGSAEIQVSAGQVSTSGSSSGSGSSDSSQGTNVTRTIGTQIITSTKSDFWNQLQQTLQLIIADQPQATVVTNPTAGIVVVRAPSAAQQAVRDYLEQAQLIMQRQVILEAKILEVILNDGFQQGINWSYFAPYTNQVDDAGVPNKSLTLGQSSEALANLNLEGIFSASLRINDFNALIQLLSTQGTVQVLSSPRIATVNNQKAVIKVGSDEFFVTDIDLNSDSSNTSSSSSTNTDITLTPFFSGISLDVTPQISEDGRITLHVHPSVSEVTDQEKVVSLGDRDLTLPLAFSTIRETDSIISAEDGQVVVIGGLIRDTTEDTQASVPVLGDLPGVGSFFRQTRKKSQKSELVILIRPVLADSSSVRTDISRARQRMGALRDVLTGE